MRTEYISIHKVISEYLITTNKNSETDEELALMFADNAIDELMVKDNLKLYIFHGILYNNKVQLPANFRYPLQVAYRVQERSEDQLQTTVSEYIQRSFDDDCNKVVKVLPSKDKLNSDCDSYPIEINATDVLLASNPELALNYSKLLVGYSNQPQGLRSNLHGDFTIAKPSRNYFFNLPDKIKSCQVPNLDNFITYTIEDRIIDLNLNNRKTEILVSYTGRRLDDDGFQMIPNEAFVFEAVKARIMQGFALRDYHTSPTQITERMWMNMMQYADRLISKARSRLRIPDADQWDSMMDNIARKRIADDPAIHSNDYYEDRYKNNFLGYN